MSVQISSIGSFDDRAPDHRPLLSVVCAVYNGQDSLQALLDSYAAQQTAETELVVIDAQSTDRTWAIVQARRGIVAAALSEPDHGIYDAWNKSLPLCRGRFVGFIGCDDVIAPGALQALTDVIRILPVAAGDAPHIIAGFLVQTRKGVPAALLGEPFRLSRLPKRMMLAHVMAAHDLAWLRAAGGFDPAFRSSGDYALLLRQRAGLRVQTLPVILAFMEEGGISRKLWLPHLENFQARRRAGLSMSLSLWLLLRAAGFTVFRVLGWK